jgi:NAD(P)-dependent dehydrogenase (short-subunit alcohol dehydrogenase family)
VRPIEDQTIMISGATDGLGKSVAAELAAYGATLLLHGRDDGKGADTVREIQRRTGNPRVHWYRADLSSLHETADLADRIADDHGRLDVLVNNAGVGYATPGAEGRRESQDGYELRFAVNYLAPYLLTRKLAAALLHSAPSRVVNIASVGQVAINFDDVMQKRDYDGVRAYRQSKLALIMFTFDLAGELAGSGVTVNCLHPATFMPTKMVVGEIQPQSSLQEGVRATMRLIVSPALERVTGRYYEGLEEAAALGQAYDKNARRRLRELSGRLTGLVTSR